MPKPSIYLSIDIDYWQGMSWTKDVLPFLQQVRELDVPTHAALHHHHLLQHVTRHPTPMLINMDTHSDVIEVEDLRTACGSGRKLECHCGDWLNFVPGCQHKILKWLHHPDVEPSPCGRGYLGDELGDIPTEEARVLGWRKVTIDMGLPTDEQLRRVQAVGVCLSPDYHMGGREWDECYRDWVKDSGLRLDRRPDDVAYRYRRPTQRTTVRRS
jgi:hypothetical protein